MKLHKQQGGAAVEMAVILLPMLILCFGIAEVGRALYLYNGLVKATRGAARHLSMQNLNSPPAGKTAQSLRDEAISLAECGYKNCDSNDPLVFGLTAKHISVCDPLQCAATHSNQGTGGVNVNLVSVTIGVAAFTGAYTKDGAAPVTYQFASVVPWVIPHIEFASVTTTMAPSF